MASPTVIYILWFWITLYIIFPTFNALNEVLSIDITIPPSSIEEVDGRPGSTSVTLWYNVTIYQIVFSNLQIGKSHIFTGAQLPILGHTICPKYHQNESFGAKIMIQVNDAEGIEIDMIKILTADNWYGIKGRCIDDELKKTQYWVWTNEFWAIDEAKCPSGKSNYIICVDNDMSNSGDSCGPSKQMLYFDTTRPNEYITDAFWDDATNVFPEQQVITCDPSEAPTQYPSQNPSMIPTHNPTVNPTTNPSQIPSKHRYPTIIPTHNPELYPSETLKTFNPTNLPSNPTDSPLYLSSTKDALNPMSMTLNAVLFTSKSNDQTIESNREDNIPNIPKISWKTIVWIVLCSIACLGCSALLMLCYVIFKKRHIISKKIKNVSKNEIVMDGAVHKKDNIKLCTNNTVHTAPNVVMIQNTLKYLKHIPSPKTIEGDGERVAQMANLKIKSGNYDECNGVVLDEGEFVVKGDDEVNTEGRGNDNKTAAFTD